MKSTIIKRRMTAVMEDHAGKQDYLQLEMTANTTMFSCNSYNEEKRCPRRLEMNKKKKSAALAVIAIFIISDCISSLPAEAAAVEGAEKMVQEPSIEITQTNSSDAEGYLLFAPLHSTMSYLINYDGDVLHTWPSEYNPGNAVYLLKNGNLLHTGSLHSTIFEAGGSGGIVQEISWNGEVIWEFEYSSDQYLLHHDVEELPNGNILMIAWEYKTAAEAITAGRNPNLLQDSELWPDKVIEVDPSTNQIVWEWHVWDHLVQDFDATKENYNVPADHPELIDLNFANQKGDADWNHINSVDYNPELDQILLSVHAFNEIWIIDHSTTTEEAAGHSEGSSGMGGDLLYRWGNPQTYGIGSSADQQLFGQHDAQWIESGLPGAGNILIFNNGSQRNRPYSTIEEVIPPLNGDGLYTFTDSTAFGPAAATRVYTADPSTDFFATNISGMQRLPNGNTLICDWPIGSIFEMTPEGEVIWRYDYGGPVFRVTEISSTHPGLVGLDLQPGKALKDTVREEEQSQPQGDPQQNLRDGSPQEAIDACSGLSVGSACTFQAPNRTVSGSCKNNLNQMTCIPTSGVIKAQ
jgi:hypothetical protein